MNTKLTLSLKKEVIEKAKSYAKQHNISLSALVENYFSRLTMEYKNNESTVGVVEEMSGIIDLENDYDYKKELGEYYMLKLEIDSLPNALRKEVADFVDFLKTKNKIKSKVKRGNLDSQKEKFICRMISTNP
jgi:recombinational DNA repair protein RecR